MPRTEHLIEAALFATAAALALVGFGALASTDAGFRFTDRDPDNLRIVTWNVGTKNGDGGSPMNDDDIPAISRTLLQLDPDIVFLQEVRSREQLGAMRQTLGADWREFITWRGDRRLAVLAQRGSISARSIKLGTRRPGVRVVYRSDARPPLAAVALHADAFSAKRRNLEIGRATDALLQSGEQARLLVGDLNLDLDLGKRRDLFSDDEHRDVEAYNYVVSKFFDVGVGRGATAEPDRRIDYIFVSERLAVVAAGPWKDKRVGNMDHDPLVADLRFID